MNEDEPQNEDEVTTITIQQAKYAKYALKIIRHFVEITSAGISDGTFSKLSNLE